jgi:hypothetical protein
MQPLQPIDTAFQNTPVPRQTDDDISLVDIATTIWMHRRASMAAFAVVLACGLAAAALLPDKYRYVTTIEIGSRSEDGKTVPIESVDTTLSKLQEAYIPAARRDNLQGHPDGRGEFATTARVPKNSQLVVLESKASEAKSAPYRQIQEQAVQALLADHGSVFKLQRMAIEQQKQRAEADLQGLADRAVALQQQLDRLKQADQLLEQQIADTRALLDVATTNRTRAVSEARDEARAMTLLMLESEVHANRARLADLQQKLQIGQAERRDQLKNELRQNKRNQALQQAEIQQIDLRIKELRETRVLGLAIKSPRPVGSSRTLLVALSLTLGAILAVLLPLVLEFIDRVRQGLAAVPAGEMTVAASAD